MKYDEFIKEVQHRAALESRDQAEVAARATLNTLAERIAGDETEDLAAQLPQELKSFLLEHKQEPKSAQTFSLDEFVKRVSDREQVDVPEATNHARLVFEVLAKAVTTGELEDVKANLPKDYEPLFTPVS